MSKKIDKKMTVEKSDLEKLISSFGLELNEKKVSFTNGLGEAVEIGYQLGVRSDMVAEHYWLTFLEIDSRLYYFTSGYRRPVLSDDEDENCLVKSKYILQKFCELTKPVSCQLSDDLAFLLDKVETIKRRIDRSIEKNQQTTDEATKRYAEPLADAMKAVDMLLHHTTRAKKRSKK